MSTNLLQKPPRMWIELWTNRSNSDESRALCVSLPPLQKSTLVHDRDGLGSTIADSPLQKSTTTQTSLKEALFAHQLGDTLPIGKPVPLTIRDELFGD